MVSVSDLHIYSTARWEKKHDPYAINACGPNFMLCVVQLYCF